MNDEKDKIGEDAPTWDPASDPDGYTRERVVPPDFALDALLNLYGGDSGKQSLTLTVVTGGILVSGTLVTRQAWQAALLASMQGAGMDQRMNITERLADVWDTWNARILEEAKRRDEADLPGAYTRHFHMRDAQVNGRQMPLYRGLVSSITGWSIGVFTD
jgi:hypothetical protein